MTAIIGYINRKENKSVGVLSADDLEGWTQSKVDKLSKLSERFVIGVIGLEAVHWLIGHVFEYFEEFNGSLESITSIKDFEIKLSEAIPKVFKKWFDEKYFENISSQLDINSELVVLDLNENILYYADLGKVWKINDPEYKVKFILLEDGLYTFGIAVNDTNLKYKLEQCNLFTKEEIYSVLKKMFKKYESENSGYVGNMGATEINILGHDPYESFTSCFSSYMMLIENLIARQKTIKSLPKE